MSGLYFRGKLAYGSRFGPVTAGRDRTFVITPTQGLRSPWSPVTTAQLREFASVDVNADDPRYRVPLERDLMALDASLERDARVVLLGSIATSKYVDALLRVVGPRLVFPAVIRRARRHEPRRSAAAGRPRRRRARIRPARFGDTASRTEAAEARTGCALLLS